MTEEELAAIEASLRDGYPKSRTLPSAAEAMYSDVQFLIAEVRALRHSTLRASMYYQMEEALKAIAAISMQGGHVVSKLDEARKLAARALELPERIKKMGRVEDARRARKALGT